MEVFKQDACHEAVKEAVEKFWNMSTKGFVSIMKRKGRIIEECWSCQGLAK